MPDDRDLEAIISDLKGYSERNDHRIQNDIETTTEDGRQVKGYNYLHGDNRVRIQAIEQREPIVVVYSYSLPEVLAVERIQQGMDGEQPIQRDLVEREIPAARQELKSQTENLDPRKVMDLRNALVQALSAPETQYSPDTEVAGIPIEFTIIRNMFPDRDQFDISDYNRATQSVVSVGIRGQSMLQNAYNLSVTDGSGSSTTPSDGDSSDDAPVGRGFQ